MKRYQNYKYIGDKSKMSWSDYTIWSNDVIYHIEYIIVGTTDVYDSLDNVNIGIDSFYMVYDTKDKFIAYITKDTFQKQFALVRDHNLDTILNI